MSQELHLEEGLSMIPKHDEIRIPALHLLTKHKQLHKRDCEAPLAKHFQLSEEEIQKKYESGSGKKSFMIALPGLSVL